jgi:threonine dehydrogenase-like Zn-dependent dehydrogenase
MPKVKACIKEDTAKVGLTDIELTDPGPGQALIRTTMSTICGSDIHITDDIEEVPVGMPMGHEGLGIVEAVGEGVERFKPGDRVVSCCLQSCGECTECTTVAPGLCSVFGAPMNLVFGAQGEAFIVNGADNTLGLIPEGLDDRFALFTADVLSTGFGAIERGELKPGQTVAIFAQGPVGLCATMGAKHYGAGRIIVVESIPERIALAKRFGADEVVTPETAVEDILEMTGGTGVDLAVEALGKDVTFTNCCKVARLGGIVSSVGVYSTHDTLPVPTDGSFFHRKIVTTFCPAGGERMAELLKLMENGKVDPTPMITHTIGLDDVVGAYDMFRNRDDGCVKIALTVP